MTILTSSARSTVGLWLLALLLGLLAPLALATPAAAAPRVTVTNDRGGASADSTYRTPFTVSGSGFQSIRGGFGGIYLAFGWVRDPGGGAWKPSRGGTTGADYRYVPDSETGSNAGYLRFVAFPGSSTAGEAHAVMSPNGSFEVDLAVPGPVFESRDRDGDPTRVDCREVTCGVITFGAHGVRNARNESFTPVDFGDVYGGEQPTGQGPGGQGPAEGPAAPGADEPTAGAGEARGAQADQGGGTDGRRGGAAARSGRAAVLVDRATAVAGHAMAFTARGFSPGEQVVAVLDDGVVSLGPMTAGAAGEVAGVLPLPEDIDSGTHVLRVTGAASGSITRARFPIVPAADVVPVADDAEAEPAGLAGWLRGLPWSLLFVGLAVVVLLAALAWRLGHHLRSRRRARAGIAPVPAVAP